MRVDQDLAMGRRGVRGIPVGLSESDLPLQAQQEDSHQGRTIRLPLSILLTALLGGAAAGGGSGAGQTQYQGCQGHLVDPSH